MKTRFIAVVVACLISGAISALEISTNIPALNGDYPSPSTNYASAQPFDFNASLFSIQKIQVILSGIHSNGVRHADGVGDNFIGAACALQFDSQWIPSPYNFRVNIYKEGAFSVTATVSGAASFLQDGVSDLSIWHEGYIFISDPDYPAYWVKKPWFRLTNVTVKVTANKIVPPIKMQISDGLITWSNPAIYGVTFLQGAYDISAPWIILNSRLDIGGESVFPVSTTNSVYRILWFPWGP